MTDFEQTVFATAYTLGFGNFAQGAMGKEAGRLAIQFAMHAVVELRVAVRDYSVEGLRPNASDLVMELKKVLVRDPPPDEPGKES